MKLMTIQKMVILGGIIVCQNVVAQMPPMPPPPVPVEKVGVVEVGGSRRFVGYIEPIHEVELQARVSGYLNKVNFKEGAMVQEGDLLFEIEDTSYRAKVMSAKASLMQMEAELRYANDNYNRKEALAEQLIVSATESQDAIRLLELAKARVDAAKAELMSAENDLSYTKIYSPISGKIGRSSYTAGAYITPQSKPLAKVVQMDPVFIKISLSSRDFLDLSRQRIEEGADVMFKLFLSNGSAYKAPWHVSVVNNEISSTTDTINVWVTYENPQKLLVPGGYVIVLMAEKLPEPLPAIPASATLNDAKGSYVYVVDGENRAQKRYVVFGSSVDDKITVVDGLAVNETVVTDGTHKIMQPGTVIAPITAGEMK